jgi:chromosomal replication initiation ATPase DnaA
MTQQLTFDWPIGVALGPEDFFVAPANARAYAMLSAPETWPDRKLVITGPAGSGKSHLTRVAQAQMGGQIYDSRALPESLPKAGEVVIVEDMDMLPATSQEFMFHLHNHLRNTGGYLLMTSQKAPPQWPLTLPDLASRVQASSIARIDDPDDSLLAALIMKLMADRQIMPPPALVSYLVPRVERSFAAAAHIVAALDSESLSSGRAINIKLAASLLDKSAE